MTKFSFQAHNVKDLEVLKDCVLVADMAFKGRTLSSGVVLLGDNSRASGIRPRWAQVYKIGPDQHDVKIGDWILVEHGRWTRGVQVEENTTILTVRRVETSAILAMSDHLPSDVNLGRSNPSTVQEFDFSQPMY